MLKSWNCNTFKLHVHKKNIYSYNCGGYKILYEEIIKMPYSHYFICCFHVVKISFFQSIHLYQWKRKYDSITKLHHLQMTTQNWIIVFLISSLFSRQNISKRIVREKKFPFIIYICLSMINGFIRWERYYKNLRHTVFATPVLLFLKFEKP